MKKLSIICMAALLVMAASCKKDKEQNGENTGKGFRATVESHVGDSKTHLEGIAVKWDSNDAIMVSGNTYTSPMRFSTTDNGDVAYFNAEDMPEDYLGQDNFTAYYPADAFDGTQLELLPTQTYVENTFANGTNPMAAYDETTTLHFKNICGVLELQLYSSMKCYLKTITITSNDPNEKLWGKGMVTIDEEGIPSLGVLSDGGNSITLNCNGEQLDKNESGSKSFYFVIPANTLASGFTVTVTDMSDAEWTKTTSAKTEPMIQRSQISQMPKTDVMMGALPKPFSVAIDKKVYFSKGNLMYLAQGGMNGNASATAEYGQSVGGTWKFADTQYEYVGKAHNLNSASDYTEWIDLFGWGTSGYNHGGTYYQPWCRGVNQDVYTYYYVYGNPEADLNGGEGAVKGMADWGYNRIYNGGNNENVGWRTLTGGEGGEWEYLLEKRTNASNLRAVGQVNNRKGLIILPDDWTKPEGVNFTSTITNFNTNKYTLAQWELMEKAGAAFLVDAGYRRHDKVGNYGGRTETWMDLSTEWHWYFYWTSTHNTNGDNYEDAHDMFLLGGSYISPTHANFRPHGFPVRLVIEK